MLQKYSVMNGRIVQGDEGSIQVEVYIMPDEAERKGIGMGFPVRVVPVGRDIWAVGHIISLVVRAA